MTARIITFPSTGTCPVGWRIWWHHQSVADGSDWIGLAEVVTAIMYRLAGESS